MRLGLIGGVERSEADFVRLGERAGHVVEFHAGHMAGRGAAALEALIERADLVVIVTDVNSHGAVLLARRVAGKLGRRTLLLRRLGVSRFSALLAELAAGQLHAA
jgi:Uncharacterized protein conserved in bacteria (DUF2325)